MISEKEDDLICDLAETYGIYDYRSYPVQLIATLAYGLRSDARIRQAGEIFTLDTLLRAITVDRLGLLVWAQTKDAQKGRNRPKSITEALTKKKEDQNLAHYSSIEEFDRKRREILGI